MLSSNSAKQVSMEHLLHTKYPVYACVYSFGTVKYTTDTQMVKMQSLDPNLLLGSGSINW